MEKRRREKGREEEEEEEEEGKRNKGMDFWILIWVLVLYGFLACSKPRVLLGDYPNPRIVEVVWVKP